MRTKRVSWSHAVRPAVDDALEAQSMVEYALMLVLVVIACVVSVTVLGDQVFALWDSIDRLIRVTLAAA